MIYEPILQILLKGLPKVDQIKPLAAPELLEEKQAGVELGLTPG